MDIFFFQAIHSSHKIEILFAGQLFIESQTLRHYPHALLYLHGAFLKIQSEDLDRS